jgi:hypothetical protein
MSFYAKLFTALCPALKIFITSLPNLSPVIGLTEPSFVWFLPGFAKFLHFLPNFLSCYITHYAKLYTA